MGENSTILTANSHILKQLSPLGECQLGDIVQISEGNLMSIRAIGMLPNPALTVGGFVIMGEFECLIAAPSRVDLPHLFYKPLKTLPAESGSSVVLAEGVCRYWAPHLPGLKNAMSELPFRVIEIPGNINPWIIVYRGPELIVFTNTGEIDPNNINIKKMQYNPKQTEGDVKRYTAIVQPDRKLQEVPTIPQVAPQTKQPFKVG